MEHTLLTSFGRMPGRACLFYQGEHAGYVVQPRDAIGRIGETVPIRVSGFPSTTAHLPALDGFALLMSYLGRPLLLL